MFFLRSKHQPHRPVGKCLFQFNSKRIKTIFKFFFTGFEQVFVCLLQKELLCIQCHNYLQFLTLSLNQTFSSQKVLDFFCSLIYRWLSISPCCFQPFFSTQIQATHPTEVNLSIHSKEVSKLLKRQEIPEIFVQKNIKTKTWKGNFYQFSSI